MPPSSASDRASGRTALNFSNEKGGRAGRAGAGDAAKSRADGRDREAEEPAKGRRDARSRSEARPMRPESAEPRMTPSDAAARRAAAASRCPAAPRAWSFGTNAAGSRPGSVRPKQVVDLAREDDDRDAGGEADRHGVRDVLDVGAEPQEADRRAASRRPSWSRGGTRRTHGARCRGDEDDEGARPARRSGSGCRPAPRSGSRRRSP